MGSNNLKGYYKTVYCCREEESPDEPSLYDILGSLQKAVALNQKSIAILHVKLDEVLAKRKKPKVEVGYRS